MQNGGDSCNQYACRYVLELESMDLTATRRISNRVWNKFTEHRTMLEYFMINSFCVRQHLTMYGIVVTAVL